VTDYSTNEIFVFAHTLIDEMAAHDPLFASQVGIARPVANSRDLSN